MFNPVEKDLTMLLAKPIATAAIATGIQQYVFTGLGFPYAASFGASVGTGVLVADIAATQLHGNQVTRSIEKRALELGLGVGAGLAIHKYIMGNDFYGLPERIAIATAAEIGGEYVANTFLCC